jgi:hypothetical protein
MYRTDFGTEMQGDSSFFFENVFTVKKYTLKSQKSIHIKKAASFLETLLLILYSDVVVTNLCELRPGLFLLFPDH